MQKSGLITGRILNVAGNDLYLARGDKILFSQDGGRNWQTWVRLPVKFWQRVAMRVPLLARLFRLGVHHLGISAEVSVVIANKESFLIEDGLVTPLGRLQGSRPMVLCVAEGAVYYGEYRSNLERSPVSVYRLDIASRSWRSVWRFEGVRHVHGVFYDSYTNALWVTTGDTDEEVAIWRSDDDFRSLYKVVGGSQQFRAVQLLFTAEHVYFGSDAPNEPNYIYRMNRSGDKVEKLAAVGGPIFYGCSVGKSLFFSTAVEPSAVNTTPFVEVWNSGDGASWQKLSRFKKDPLSMKYFQYGQLFFPAGQGDDCNLWCSPFATKGHGYTFKLFIESQFS